MLMHDHAVRSLLSVSDLHVHAPSQELHPVRGVTFDIRPGETVTLVGESGSGKSLTARSIAGLLPDGLVPTGSIEWSPGGAGTAPMTRVSGPAIGMLLQDPFTLLNPTLRVGDILEETLKAGGRAAFAGVDGRASVDRRLAEVGIDPTSARGRYPWELSGGMCQRVGLAASIARGPSLLIADEPTTALDATTQRDVLRLIRRLQQSHRMALLLITHDLRIALSISDRVLVMSEGLIVDEKRPNALAEGPIHPYTQKLLAAELPLDRRLPDLRIDVRLGLASPTKQTLPKADERDGDRSVLLTVRSLTKRFGRSTRKAVAAAPQALNGVDLEVQAGRSLGVLGESGSGKTTLARCILGLEQATSGAIHFGASGRGQRLRQRDIQCVFQDPYSSLNPAHSIGFTLREAIRMRGERRDPVADHEEVAAMLDSVGLDSSVVKRRPDTLSGGQRQRVAIARALLLRPQLLVCDEPVAALDLTVQSQVLDVLRDAQKRGITLLLITHDVSVARQMTDDLIVLCRGEVVERGVTDDVIDNPTNPYTQRLLESVPTGRKDWLDEARQSLPDVVHE